MAMLLPLVAEGAEILVAGAESAEAVATFEASVGSAVQQVAKSAIGAFISNHVGDIVDSVLGQGTYKKTMQDLEQNANEASSYLTDFEFGLPFGTTAIKKQQELKEYKRTHPLTQEESNQMYYRLAQLYLEEHKPENQKKQEENCSCSHDQLLHGSLDKELPNTKQKLNVSQIIVGSGSVSGRSPVDKVNSDAVTQSPELSLFKNTNIPESEIFTTQNIDQQAVTDNKLDFVPQIEKIDSNYGSKVGEFIVKFISHTLNKPEEPITDFLVQNPHLLQVGKHYLDFVKEQGSREDLTAQQVKVMFTGTSIDTDKVYKDQQGHFSIVDETGNIESYTGRSAPRFANKTQLIGLGFIPTIHGVWTGPKSPNNDFPIDLLDTFSMMHDIEYNNHGWFYELGDLKYINRINNNMYRMSFYEQSLAKFCVKWFSTIGKALAKVSGSLSEPTNSQQSVQDDFFNYLVKVNQKNVNYYEQSPLQPLQLTSSTGQSPELNAQRNDFYTGLKDKADELFVTLAPSVVESNGTGMSFNASPVYDLPVYALF